MRGEGDSRDGTACVGKLLERGADAFDVRRNEIGVIIEDANFIDDRRVGSGRFLSSDDVLAILTAAGIRTVGRREDRQYTPLAVVGHLLHGLW